MSAFDRTILIYVVDENMVTADFIGRLQKSVLNEFPLWRIYLYDYHSVPNNRQAEGLMIYPAVVRVREDVCPPTDLERSLSNWRKYYAELQGPSRRQFRYVKRRLLGKVRELEHADRPVVFVAAFDNWQGLKNKQSVCQLQTESATRIRPTRPEVAEGGGGPFIVSSEGKLRFGKDRFKGPSRTYFLLRHTFDPLDEYVIVLNGFQPLPNQLEKDGREWRIPITKNDIITDPELKAAEERGELGP